MVRRRLLSNSARQTSMSAYQNFWQQPQQQPHRQSTLPVSMPPYWHSMAGAVPRLAVMAPPEASSRRLSRLRRQLVKAPTNYVQQAVPLQRGYQTMWDRCCMNQGTLLKPGAFLPGFQQCPQRSFHQYQQGNLFSYPAAVQTHQVQWLKQHHQPVPAGILKKVSQVETPALHNPKRVTIKSPAVVRRRFQAPSVEQVKPRPKPEVPPKPDKRARQHLLKREQQRVLQHQELRRQQQIQKDLLEKQELQKEVLKKQELQNELQKRQQALKDLQIRHERQKQLQKQQQLQQDLLKKQELEKDVLKKQELGKAQEQKELPGKSMNFNFGKFASSFLESTGIPPTETFNKFLKPNRNNNFCYEGTKHTPEKEDPEDPRKREAISREGKTYSPRFLPLDLGSETSTITLTAEQNQFKFEPAKTHYRSQTRLTDKATNTQIDPLGELLKQGPQKPTLTTGKGSRKLNINELLRSEQMKDLNADPMWHSLKQLVAQMCENTEQKGQADKEAKSRLRAGFGADEGSQKQYSVYLVVTSDEDEDECAGPPNTEVESSRMASEERIQMEDEFSERCANGYQAEHPSLGRRKRTRKRRDDLAYPFSSSQILIPMRRPLHWPKQDYSKPSQGRSNRGRTPSRVRSRSSTKHSLSSLSSALDPKRSWRLWEDLPMTAKTLNKAYSRRLSRSGGTTSCTHI